ncbi:hypothetical protein BDN72DRAFT_834992 [Pluteus cervinus]|uniref:Uncharacterized protein n=1 Tax=Pluteus cervinus TaxID=181527 RepID=A0ACD3B4N6_9AGAR|nr:hypothetical protein BDN72DRAFT_834992 [Pluteus cervinus]
MASLTSFRIIIAQETGPWPRLAGIGEGGWPERVPLATYKTRVAHRIALQGEADNSLFGGECLLCNFDDEGSAWKRPSPQLCFGLGTSIIIMDNCPALSM